MRSAVGPHIGLRADANRGWDGLQRALVFGRAVAAAGVGLQYVEEPTADPRDMAAFFRETGGSGSRQAAHSRQEAWRGGGVEDTRGGGGWM